MAAETSYANHSAAEVALAFLRFTALLI